MKKRLISVLIEPEQIKELKSLARELSITESSIIRTGIYIAIERLKKQKEIIKKLEGKGGDKNEM